MSWWREGRAPAVPAKSTSCTNALLLWRVTIRWRKNIVCPVVQHRTVKEQEETTSVVNACSRLTFAPVRQYGANDNKPTFNLTHGVRALWRFVSPDAQAMSIVNSVINDIPDHGHRYHNDVGARPPQHRAPRLSRVVKPKSTASQIPKTDSMEKYARQRADARRHVA